MSDRAWRRAFNVTAVGFGLAVLALIVVLAYQSGKKVGAQRQDQQTQSAHYAADAEEEIRQRCLGRTPFLEAKCIREVVEATHEHHRSEQDVVAQNEMALWALGMLIVSGASMLLTGAGLWLIYGTLHYTRRAALYGGVAARAARKTVDVTREIGNAQVRAYLTIKECGAWLTDTDGICVVAEIENLGSTPARDAHFICEIFCNVPAKGDWLPTDGDWLEQRTFYTRPWVFGDVLAHSTKRVGPINFQDLDLPEDVIRTEGGLLRLGMGQIGIFAADVFSTELYESGDLFIFTTALEYSAFRAAGGGVPSGSSFHDDTTLRKRGWSDHYFKRGKPRRQTDQKSADG